MPIDYIHRDQLDELKYNECIEQSKQGLLYGYSWYLDLVCDHWDALVWDDYSAVMPVPWRKKYGIKYVYQPLWILQLGIFTNSEISSEFEFLNELKNRFKFIALRLNTKNTLQSVTPESSVNHFQYLTLENSYHMLSNNFNRNRKRELKKAANAGLKEIWGDQPERLVSLFEKNIGIRIKGISQSDYENLSNLIKTVVLKGRGEILSIYDQTQLVASGLFLFHKGTVTELVCATDLNNRNNGGNTFLIDRALSKYQEKFDLFDFGGSSIKTIANYYKSFGAKTYHYLFFKSNRLPFLMRLFKS